MKKLRPYLPFIPLIVVMIAVRLIYCDNIWVGPQGDAVAYLNMAKNLATHGYLGGGTSPDFSRPPLYSITLACFARLLNLPFEYWTFIALNLIYDTISVICLII